MLDSLVVHLEDPTADGSCCCSSCSRDGVELDDALRRASRALRTALSPRHVPDTIVAVPRVPRTLTGKKLEVPVKRILTGAAGPTWPRADALAEPASIEPFAAYAKTRAAD